MKNKHFFVLFEDVRRKRLCHGKSGINMLLDLLHILPV
jgi:hypothetical protein